MFRITILDKLMEKKDLFVYIDVRIFRLKIERDNLVNTAKESERQCLKERMEGRISELNYLRNILEKNNLKDACKAMWFKKKKRDNTQISRGLEVI